MTSRFPNSPHVASDIVMSNECRQSVTVLLGAGDATFS